MIVGLNQQAISLLFVIFIFCQIVYFFGMTNFQNMTLFDSMFVIVLNLLFIVVFVYGVPNIDNEEKPRSPFIAVGSSMYDSIYALHYDYKIIVDRFDRKNILNNH